MPDARLGVGVTLGAPLAAPTWFFPGGGVTDERDEYVSIFNASADTATTVDLSAVADGATVAIDDLQDVEIPAGGRRTIRLNDSLDEIESVFLVVTADGPVVVERGLYRVGGRGSSLSMGIPLAVDVLVPDPVNG